MLIVAKKRLDFEDFLASDHKDDSNSTNDHNNLLLQLLDQNEQKDEKLGLDEKLLVEKGVKDRWKRFRLRRKVAKCKKTCKKMPVTAHTRPNGPKRVQKGPKGSKGAQTGSFRT